MAALACRVGQAPQPQCDGGKGEQDVDQRQADDHLHQHV